MRSFMSSLLGAGPPADDSGTSSKVSAVTSFHSAARWQLHFISSKESTQLLVVDFSASWCGPCRFIEPAIHAMAAKFTDVAFAKIKVDELPEVSQGFGVQAMPTFVLLKRGKEVDRVVGAKKDSEIVTEIVRLYQIDFEKLIMKIMFVVKKKKKKKEKKRKSDEVLENGEVDASEDQQEKRKKRRKS